MLFDNGPEKAPPKKRTKSARTYNPVAVWAIEWKKLLHRSPMIDGKDSAMLCRMAAGMDELSWTAMCRAFFNDPAPSRYCTETGYSVGAFYSGRLKYLSEVMPT